MASPKSVDRQNALRLSLGRAVALSLGLAVWVPVVMSTIFLSACADSGKTADTPAAPPSANPWTQPPVTPTTTASTTGSCSVGQVYYVDNGTPRCLNQNSCNPGYGWLPGANQCVQGTLVTSGTTTNGLLGNTFKGNFSPSARNIFENLLQFAGVCNPFWVGVNFGSARCSTYSGSGSLTLSFTSSAGSSGSLYIYGSASGWNQPGVSQSFTASDYNSGAGFQFVATNYSGQDVGLRGYVNSGKPSNSNSFTAVLYYQNAPFATVALSRQL